MALASKPGFHADRSPDQPWEPHLQLHRREVLAKHLAHCDIEPAQMPRRIPFSYTCASCHLTMLTIIRRKMRPPRLSGTFKRMPELPDITVYLEALEKRIQGQTLKRVLIKAPFLLRTAIPPLSSAEGKRVIQLRRLGKRICIGLEDELWLVLHLMIAGRLHWRDSGMVGGKSSVVATFQFSNGNLILTEAGSRKRTSLHLVANEPGLQSLNPGGLEVFEANVDQFAAAIQSTNHTLKRALTDPRLLSGIGNAYSDEILFAAKLSPFLQTQKMTPAEIENLFSATRSTLTNWIDLLRGQTGDAFPEKVTAFRPEMAVHGRYKQPCIRCGSQIQRIRYASNEMNYCPTCQTGGKLLADRSLSRLLRHDWPRSAEELEALMPRR
jgi:formamidopyrimidine-DNA glycosylase